MVKITICGAGGGIGQNLALLLHTSLNNISHLALYDVANAHAVASDLRNIGSSHKLTSHDQSGVKEALERTNMAVITAGIFPQHNVSDEDLFTINACIVQDMATDIAKYAPRAIVCVVSNPINSNVPIVSEVFKQYYTYNPKKIFGITTANNMKASSVLSSMAGVSPQEVSPPLVIGGQSGQTIIPITSQLNIATVLTDAQIEQATTQIQSADDHLSAAWQGEGCSGLSLAHAAASFIKSFIESVLHCGTGVESAFINLEADHEGALKYIKRISGNVDYFVAPFQFSKDGVEQILPIGKISADEYSLVTVAIHALDQDIKRGIKFIYEQ